MSTFRSEGWSVHPTFVPNGPSTPVTLLFDDEALTQLAGTSVVAWQTPWSEVSNIQLVRFAKGMALFATIGGIRYCWRNAARKDYESVSEIVSARGGYVVKRPRRAGTIAVALIVVLAALSGSLAALWPQGISKAQELADAKAANLTLKDFPAGWNTSTESILSYLFPSSNQVITSTTTTAPKANSVWEAITKYYESCVGISNANDRMYGKAGQLPDYQVSSPVFTSSSFGGIQVVSTVQYYHSVSMVNRDTRQMSSRSDFGSCFASSNAAVILSQFGVVIPTKNLGVNYKPLTFIQGWDRGGVVTVSAPGLSSSLHLVLIEATHGHYEITIGALSSQWPAPKSFIANIVNTELSRITSASSKAV